MLEYLTNRNIKKVSIIIVYFQTYNYTKDCLNSILKLNFFADLEIIILDNFSSDGSIERLKKNFLGKVKIIKNDHNIGFGAANNIGAKHATGDILFFLNSDTVVKMDIIKPIISAFNEDPRLGVACPRLLLADGTPQPYAYGAIPGLINTISNKIASKKNNAEKVEWVSGAAMAVRKSIFKQIGGFDERFFMYFEDIDLCRRIKNAGYSIKVLNNCDIIHLGGKSFNSEKIKKNYYYQSQDKYFEKYYGFFGMSLIRFARYLFSFFVR